MATDYNNRLITPDLEKAMKDYPLYSQDSKKKDALCIAVFFIGSARWYILEGQREYGYISANEMASVALDASKYGLGTIMVEQEKAFQPCKLSAIQDGELQSFLNRFYD